jgi:hypothetical protein
VVFLIIIIGNCCDAAPSAALPHASGCNPVLSAELHDDHIHSIHYYYFWIGSLPGIHDVSVIQHILSDHDDHRLLSRIISRSIAGSPPSQSSSTPD